MEAVFGTPGTAVERVKNGLAVAYDSRGTAGYRVRMPPLLISIYLSKSLSVPSYKYIFMYVFASLPSLSTLETVSHSLCRDYWFMYVHVTANINIYVRMIRSRVVCVCVCVCLCVCVCVVRN